MKNSKIEPISPTPSKSELVLLSFLQSKKKVLICLFSILAIGALGGLYHTMSRKTKAKNVEMGERGIKINKPTTNLRKLKKIAANYPSLQPQLDAPLAQEYLNKGQIKTSQLLEARVLKRQAGHLKFVSEFNEISYLIEEGKYKEARAKSYVLKDSLVINPNLKTLYVSHLLRIIALEDRLGNMEQKGALLEELGELNRYPNDQLKAALSLGKLNICDYLNHKEHLQ